MQLGFGITGLIYPAHITYEETEAQGDGRACPKLNSKVNRRAKTSAEANNEMETMWQRFSE